MMSEPIINFFDVETTGLNTTTDQIVELYIAKTKGLKIIDELHLFIKPTCPMTPAAEAVHHISIDSLADKPVFAEVAKQIYDFLGFQANGRTSEYFAGHNVVKFDIIMLAEQFAKASMPILISQCQIIDTCAIERGLFPHTLIAAYKRYYGKDYSETIGDAHGAKADTLATIDVAKAQTAKVLHELPILDTPESIDTLRHAGRTNDNFADLLGLLIVDADGKLRFNFGKCNGQLVTENLGYAKWMLTQQFPSDTKALLMMYL